MDPIATRPQGKREALDQALAEAVARTKNDPAPAKAAFDAMRYTLLCAPDVETAAFLLKKLVATALSSWTPPSSDPDGFVAAAKAAGFDVVAYGAGKHPGPAVVREAGYSTSTGPLLRSVCRAFAADVLTAAWTHWKDRAPKASAEASFFAHLPALVRAGSLEAPSSPKLPAAPRFAIAER